MPNPQLPLAPRPTWLGASTPSKPQAAPTYSDSEWAALYPKIKQLYVHERRKLRYVMQCLESENGFKATPQMYKKRFTKWGFQKNAKRSECKGVSRRTASPLQDHGSVPVSPRLPHRDDLTLKLLTGVRIWSVAFFDSVHLPSGFLAPIQRKPYHDAQETGFALKLVLSLLDRGHGNLAGRMARKAFLLVERLLALDGPMLTWNLLEMTYHIVTLRHAQLFYMLLSHLIALTSQLTRSHPLLTILRSLRGLVAGLTVTPASTPKGSSTSSSSLLLSPSSDRDEAPTAIDPLLLSHALAPVLERAWILNAEIMFDHFDPRLLHLYCRINCDSCSIKAPGHIFNAASGWLSQIKTQATLDAATTTRAEGRLASNPVDESDLLQRLAAPWMDASLLPDYKTIQQSSVAALQKYGSSILTQGASFDNGDTTILLPLLAWLTTANILQVAPLAYMKISETDGSRDALSRIHAGNIVCAIRLLVDLDAECNGLGTSFVERIRAVVALRGYSEGETSPQVVQEMWELHDALVTAGEHEEAQEVERDAYRRIETYVQDIPISAA